MRFSNAVLSQVNVINALILRETRTRFGAHQLGFAWALIEPTLMILTFWALFKYSDRPAPDGMQLFGFVATGVIPYLMFAKSTTQVSQSINGNKGLLFYPQVKPLDVVFARTFLEFCSYGVVFLFLMGGEVLALQAFHVSDPLQIVIGFTLACLLGASLGLIFMGLGQISNVVDRTIGSLMRPFFWVSGLFFTVHSLPERFRGMVLYNPAIHATELVRAGWYESYDDRYVNVSYVLSWILGLAFIGLSLEIVTRRRIEVT